jgi:nicotinamide-nucleotide adenylyltransferase
MIETGVIHGRFQVLHNDHLRYLLAGKARCHHLVVGITNPDPVLTAPDEADPGRHEPQANPLTYYERYVMIRDTLVEAGLSEQEFSLVPFPVNRPDLYPHYVPMDGTFFLTIYDDWGRRKKDMFASAGLKIEVLWEKIPEEKGLLGSEIRRRMARGEAWETLVPPSVAKRMLEWDIPARLRKLLAPQGACPDTGFAPTERGT